MWLLEKQIETAEGEKWEGVVWRCWAQCFILVRLLGNTLNCFRVRGERGNPFHRRKGVTWFGVHYNERKMEALDQDHGRAGQPST